MILGHGFVERNALGQFVLVFFVANGTQFGSGLTKERLAQVGHVNRTTIHFITTISDVEDILTVLDLWYDLLKWEPQWVSAELEKYGAEDRLNQLLEHKSMEVFNRTEEVFDALQRASNKQEMMELDLSSSSFATPTRTTPFSF